MWRYRLDRKHISADHGTVSQDSEEWHRENLVRHPSHYASLARWYFNVCARVCKRALFLRFLGPQRITAIQRFYGAKLYFNTLVPWGEGKIKYGVIDRWVG